MKEEKNSQVAVNIGNHKDVNDEIIASLKEEVARLKEENQMLIAKVISAESDRDIYKKMWIEKDDKLTTLSALTKELVKFAGLA